jgi:hypothetical protein
MNPKVKQDPTTGVVKQPLGRVILAGMVFFGVLVMGATIFPYSASSFLVISVPIGIVGYASFIWINVNPNLYARFFFNVCISALCLIVSLRCLDSLLHQYFYYGATAIIALVTFAHILPIINPRVTKTIRDELSAPKTKIGKYAFKMALLLIPLVGIGSAMLTSFLFREDKLAGLAPILLFWSFIVSIILPFAYRFPSSPWEVKGKDQHVK